jgi:hypothetical protein
MAQERPYGLSSDPSTPPPHLRYFIAPQGFHLTAKIAYARVFCKAPKQSPVEENRAMRACTVFGSKDKKK